MDLNKAMIIGRLTRDPEMKSISTGANVCQIGIATSRSYTNQSTGQRVEQPEYHNVVLWNKLAEIANQYLKKGQRVYIEGRLQTRSWEGQDGKKNYRTEIIGEQMIMLDGPRNTDGQTGPSSSTGAANKQDAKQQFAEEELPTIQQEEDLSVEDIPF